MMGPSGAYIVPLVFSYGEQVGFRHPKDYVSYVWARSDEGERCLEKQLYAQVRWGQSCCPAGSSAAQWRDSGPFVPLDWGAGTSLLFAEPGAGLWCWQQIFVLLAGVGGGGHPWANPSAHQVSLGCR